MTSSPTNYSVLSVSSFLTQYNLVDGCGVTLSCNVPQASYPTNSFDPDAVHTLLGQGNNPTALPTTMYLSPRTSKLSPVVVDRSNSGAISGSDVDSNVQYGSPPAGYNTVSGYNYTPTITSGVNVTNQPADDAIARPINCSWTSQVTVKWFYFNFGNSDTHTVQLVANPRILNPMQSGYDPPDATSAGASPNATQVLYLQIARDGTDMYLMFRGPNNEYLNMLPSTSIKTNVNSSTPILLLAWSKLPSTCYSAHWTPLQITSGTGNLLIFQNRATGLCMSVDFTAVAATASYWQQTIVVNDYNTSNIFRIWTTNWNDVYGQNLYRANGISPATAASTMSAQFTISRWQGEEIRADFINNPIGPLAKQQSQVTPNNAINNISMASYINTFCSIGLNGLGDACIQYAIAQSALSSAWVPSTCSRFPNDQTLCGCLNIQKYYGINNYIQVATASQQSWLPYCNASGCANQSLAWRPANLKVNCQSQTCIQAINATATNITIKDVALSCAVKSSLADLSYANDDDQNDSARWIWICGSVLFFIILIYFVIRSSRSKLMSTARMR